MFFELVLLTEICLGNLLNPPSCHPKCSWVCDEPKCPAVCEPICSPPQCHTVCEEPIGDKCEVKCEKPECGIKCPTRGCADGICNECMAVCNAPHCINICQPPVPQCGIVCDEPSCDWKCNKPNDCPQPTCELKCENPHCTQDFSCCPCSGQDNLILPEQFFKDDEPDPNCCEC